MGDRWSRFVAGLTGFPFVEAAGADEVHQTPSAGSASAAGLGAFTFPGVGLTKSVVLSVPSLQRAHDLIVSLVAGLPLVPYRLTWNAEAKEYDEERTEPLPWHNRPDPRHTRSAFLGGIASDLWAYGWGYARVTSRYREGDFPASFAWMPFDAVQVAYPAGALPALGLVPGCRITFQGAEVPYRDVIEFQSPLTGVCETAWRAIQTAIALDEASNRFATVEMPSGWLQQVDGEPMSGEDLEAIAAAWSAARRENATGALNQFVKFVESTYDPDRLQLVEARQHQALEMARVGNVPPYLIGAPAGTGMTYQNAQTARADLVDFGGAPIIAAINETLSGPNVSPAGNFVRLNIKAWLDSPAALQTVTDNREALPPEEPKPKPKERDDASARR